MIVQRWACDKCTFHYGSPARLSMLMHHCPPKSRDVRPAKFVEGLPPRDARPTKGKKVTPKKVTPKKEPPPKPYGRVLKRRSNQVT